MGWCWGFCGEKKEACLTLADAREAGAWCRRSSTRDGAAALSFVGLYGLSLKMENGIKIATTKKKSRGTFGIIGSGVKKKRDRQDIQCQYFKTE